MLHVSCLYLSLHHAALILPASHTSAGARLAEYLHLDNITDVSADCVWPRTKFARHCMLMWTEPYRATREEQPKMKVIITLRHLAAGKNVAVQ